MSENLSDNFQSSEENLTDKKQEFTDKIGQDYQKDVCMIIIFQLKTKK